MKAYKRNQDKLRVMQAMYDRLNAIPDAERTIDQSKDLLKLADEIEKLEAKIAKQKAQASVTQEEAIANTAKASTLMNKFVGEEGYNIYFTAESGLWWYYEHDEFHSAKPPAFHEKFNRSYSPA